MKTDVLIDLLAKGAGPARPVSVARRLLPALSVSLLLAAVLALTLIGPLPATTFATLTPWVKLLPVAVLAALAWQWLVRGARPASQTAPAQRRLQAGWLSLVTVGLGSLLLVPAGSRITALLGNSWWQCPLTLTVLALPSMGLLIHAARGLPFGRAKQAGAALGLLAGCAAAAGYALACPEESPAFVAVWYSCGMLICMAVGGALGRRNLRW